MFPSPHLSWFSCIHPSRSKSRVHIQVQNGVQQNFTVCATAAISVDYEQKNIPRRPAYKSSALDGKFLIIYNTRNNKFHYTTLTWIWNILSLPDISWNWNAREQNDPSKSSTVLNIYILENLLGGSVRISNMAHARKQSRNQIRQNLSGEAGECDSINPRHVTLHKIVTLNDGCRSSLLPGVLPGSLQALHRQPSFLPFPSSGPPSSLDGQFL